MLVRGVFRRCARCGGKGAFLSGWNKQSERCHTCGFAWKRDLVGFQLGAAAMNIIMTGGAVLATMGKQIVAALPLSSTMLMNQSAWSAWSIPIVISSAIPIFAVMWTRWASDADVQLTTSRRPVLVGIAMVVCGALPAAVSVKWQTQLFWGTGYLFVFIQFVGTALLIGGLAVGLGAQVQSVGRLGRTSVLALVALAIAGTAGIHAAGIEDVAWRTEPAAWHPQPGRH